MDVVSFCLPKVRKMLIYLGSGYGKLTEDLGSNAAIGNFYLEHI